jgi:acyl dehydratase
MLVRELGTAWAEHGTLSVRFVHTAGPGDTLHTSGTVRAVNPDEQGIRVLFDILVVNQHGEHIMEGEAEATVL